MLSAHGVGDVRVEQVSGHLTDHYDPRANVIRLSESVYHATSPAAIGVAAHEAGHALQPAEGYGPIKLRMTIIPVCNFASSLAMPLFLIGILFAALMPAMGEWLMFLGLSLYSLAVIFQLVTLPVEFNASRRAMVAIESAVEIRVRAAPVSQSSPTSFGKTTVFSPQGIE